MRAKDAETAAQCEAVMDGLMEVRRNMAAMDVVKMERDSLKQQLHTSQAKALQLQQTLQQQTGVASPSARAADADGSPSTFRALAMSEIAEKEQAAQQLQAALDDASNKLMQQEALVRVRTESERQVCLYLLVQNRHPVTFLTGKSCAVRVEETAAERACERAAPCERSADAETAAGRGAGDQRQHERGAGDDAGARAVHLRHAAAAEPEPVPSV